MWFSFLLTNHMRDVSIMHSPGNPEGLTWEICEKTLAGGWEGELLNLKKERICEQALTIFKVQLVSIGLLTTDDPLIHFAALAGRY